MILKLVDGWMEDQPAWWKNFIKDIDAKTSSAPLWGDARSSFISTELEKVGATIIKNSPISIKFEDDALATLFLIRWS